MFCTKSTENTDNKASKSVQVHKPNACLVKNTIGRNLPFQKFLKCSNAIIWQTNDVTAPDWTERSADEARHNRDLHLWARSWCVRWYVFFYPTLKPLVTLDVSTHLFAHPFLSTSEAVPLMFHSEWKLLTLISGPLALDVRICFDLLIDVFVALLFCSFW